MELTDLKEPTARVRARFARRDNEAGDAPDWSEPRTVTLAVKRYPGNRKRGPLTHIAVSDFNWAEYTDADYNGNGEFLVEEYRMKITEVL